MLSGVVSAITPVSQLSPLPLYRTCTPFSLGMGVGAAMRKGSRVSNQQYARHASGRAGCGKRARTSASRTEGLDEHPPWDKFPVFSAVPRALDQARV
jgi:hypothetical protein